MMTGRGRARCAVPGRGLSGGAVSEMVAGIGARLVPIIGPPVGALLQRHRFMTVDDIPGDVYAGIESGTPTVGVAALWVVAAWLDEELIYAITQALWQPDAGQARRRPPTRCRHHTCRNDQPVRPRLFPNRGTQSRPGAPAGDLVLRSRGRTAWLPIREELERRGRHLWRISAGLSSPARDAPHLTAASATEVGCHFVPLRFRPLGHDGVDSRHACSLSAERAN